MFFIFIIKTIYLFFEKKKIIEKEVIVIERFGSYDSTLRAGVHFIMPFVKRPKVFKLFFIFLLQLFLFFYKELR